MESKEYRILKKVRFKDFILWDTKRYTRKEMKSKYNNEKLEKYIKEENKKEKLFNFPEQEFKILGVNNKIGLFDAYIEYGYNINQAYKKMENGFLAYNPYRINVGSIGIKSEKQEYEYISPAYVVFSCKEGLKPDFLYKIFKTDTFNRIINETTTGSVRQNLTYDLLKNIKIPIPDVQEQMNLLEKLNNKISEAEEKKKEAENLEKEVEKYIFDELGITIKEKTEKKIGLQKVKFKNIKRWGADFLLNKRQENVLESKIYKNDKLINLVFINPETKIDVEELSFVPMECISDKYGIIEKMYVGKKESSKGYTKFKENDLIWAKITPCMENGKSTIAKTLLNGYGYGSTEFHVLREKENSIRIEYLYHLLRLKIVREDAVTHFSGTAGQQRVPSNFLEELIIPIPDIEIQDKIVKKISEVKSLIKQLQEESLKIEVNAIKEFENELFYS